MKTVQRSWHRVPIAFCVVLALCVGAAVVLAIAAAPAHAFPKWAHGGIPAGSCPCHNNGPPTDASCTVCHTGYKSPPGYNCWSCHAPGQDTSSFSSSSAACTQTCHLYSDYTRDYTTAFTHSADPHLGSTADCLSCHSTSSGIADPGLSPHHSASQQGFTDCTACHTGFTKHAGQVTCTTCHKTAAAFHLHKAKTPGFKQCSSCHSMKHAGKSVPQSKCAACHKGTGTGGAAQAQHSATITKKLTCSACHKQKLHAASLGSGIKSCGTCHKSLYHAKQKLPGTSACTKCHSTAKQHSNGYQCSVCHSAQIHNLRPSVPKIGGLGIRG
ncbi:MAG: hypothetical protein WBS54_13890 [Acidobacteriota bacterium]